MREICIPIPTIVDNKPVDIEIKTSGNEKLIQFRIESFPFIDENEQYKEKEDKETSGGRIIKLKKIIESYDKSWELIQIFAPLNNSKFIQVLFRKK
jgi:hypothetical protein